MKNSIRYYWYRGLSFFQWVFRLSSVDKLDSPFLFRFYQEVIKQGIREQRKADIQKLKIELLQSIRKSDSDHPIGQMNSPKDEERSIRESKKKLISTSKCRLFYALVRYFKPNKILYFGRSSGISTLCLKAGYPDTSIISIEEHISTHRINSIPKIESSQDSRLIKDPILNNITDSLSDPESIDFIVIGSDQDGPQIRQIYQSLADNMAYETTVVFDDIYKSRDRTNTWYHLKSSGHWNIAIDLWYCGLLIYEPKIKEKMDVRLPPRHFRWHFGIFR